ncbi:zinc ribbon domain-containing protein [Streptomyces antimycoticus]|uniref:zinc ribbon domain-containing protein n=1 Tax=Streptomyces antimycoticus TaxID=68175 RepID=UPI0036A55C95
MPWSAGPAGERLPYLVVRPVVRGIRDFPTGRGRHRRLLLPRIRGTACRLRALPHPPRGRPRQPGLARNRRNPSHARTRRRRRAQHTRPTRRQSEHGRAAADRCRDCGQWHFVPEECPHAFAGELLPFLSAPPRPAGRV